jgi:PAS domain S-box-containing protein
LEGSTLDAELAQANLRKGGIDCEVTRVQTRADFAAALEKDGFDLVLSDYALRSFDGLSALKMTRKVRPNVPFILVSDALGEEVAIESIKSGATDYVLKHRLERLVPAVRRAVREAKERRKRERAEQALWRSEQRFRALVENASDIVAILEADGTISYESPAVKRVLGYEPEERVGTNVFDHIHSDDLGPARSSFAEILEKPAKRVSARYRVRNKEGSWRRFEAIGANLLHDPSIQGIVINSRDLTEREWAEEVLRESEERFRATFDQAAVGVAQVAPDASWLRVNQRLCEITGYAEEELLETTFQEITHPDDLQAELEQARQLLVGEIDSYSMEKRYFHKDGSTVWADLTASLVREPSGEPMYFIIVIKDINERKRTEEVLQESEEWLRSSLANVPVVLFGLDRDGNFVVSEGKGLETLGFKPGEVVGRSVFELYRDVPQIRRNVSRALAGEEVHAVVEVAQTAFETWYSPLRKEDTDVAGVGGIAIDISERKRTEAALIRSEERYRTFVEQSTDGIWRWELEQPLPVDTPDDEQMEHLYHHAYLAECNDAMARMYGFSRADELSRSRFSDLLSRSVPENMEYLRAFIRSGYRLTDTESYEIDRWGNARHFLNNLTGFVENGSLVRVWGIRRDVTEARRIEDALRYSEELYRMVVEQATENIFLVDAKTKQILEANGALHRSLGYTAEEMQRLTLYDIVAHHRESVDRYTQCILEEGRFFIGERKYRRKDETLLDVEVSASAIPRNGRVALCVTAHDITERKRAEDKLRRSLDALLGLYEAGQVLGSTLESEEVGSRILTIMRRVSSLSTAVISRLDEHGRLSVWRAVGLENLPKKIRYTPGVEATLQEVLETGENRMFLLESLEEDARSLVGLCLPLRIRNRSIGLLEVYGPEDLLEEDTMDILGSMTSQATSALENARLYGELAEREKRLEDLVGKLLRAQEEEHRRVAYEVHDGLAQVAVAAHQHLQAFSRRYPPDTQRGERDLQRVSRLVRQTVSDARKIIANLRPTALDDLGLAAAIRLEVERLREEGYQVSYENDLRDKRLPEQAEITLFRVAQEALTNARKHAQTWRAHVELRCGEDEVRLEVRDYGRGFDPAVAAARSGPGERVGLAGMQERVSMLGGELKVRSKSGEGTSVTVTLPVTAEEG